MHQPDPAADLAARKMAHPADLPRRGSGASGNPAAVTLTGVPGMGSHALSSEDYQMQPQLAPSALHPPQTLNLMSQPLVQSGAQIKKKSGFQITSVTPAQISANMSSNNSIAEDTESYDDLDESHTEDLSSSEILDVSLSRATDLGGPERSSSEETLNNFQEAETPGAASPNQPHLPQHPLPPNVQQSIMINGNVHHHHHHLHHHHGHHPPPHAGLPAVPFHGGPLQNTGSVKPAVTGNSESPVTAASVSTVPSAAVPAVGPASQVVRKASGPVSAGVNPTTGGSTISGVSTTLPSGINVNPSGATSASSVSAMSGNLNTNLLGASSNGSGASAGINLSGAAAAVGPAAGQQPAVPFTATSRFRVVKLDSSTEPFKKGRWTCMEFYDKENAVPSEAAAAINKAVESIKQNPLEVTSERESTSGSSVSSNISTLSHYTDSVGSGEMGASTTMQQPGFQGLGPPQMDFSNTVAPNVPAPNIPQSISQSQLAQLQMHPQDASYSPQKQVGASAQTALNAATGVQPAPVNILGVQSSLGHPQAPISTMVPQQLPYPPQAQPISSLPTVQQQLQYAHQQTAPAQMAPGHVMPVNQTSVPGNVPEYLQHPQILQTAVTPVQPSSTVGGNPATVPVVQAQVMQAPIQSTAQAPPAVAPLQPVAHAQATMPATGGQVLGVCPQVNIPSAVPQAATSQQSSTGLQQGAPIPSQQVLPPSQGIQLGAPGHPQQVIIAPQNTLLPPKPPTQLIEPAVPGMASQQVPVVSPLHAASGVPPVQLSTNIPSGMPPTGTTLGPLPAGAQPLPTQNGSLVQNINQAPVLQSVPVAQNMPLPMAPGTGQYVAPSLIQSVPSQMEDIQRLDHTAIGVPYVVEGIALDVSGAGSLLPLKSLPLSTALVDGEDESSSSASVVAIDNKIEQAMDLVKSHLMYAVREEVEVLKEQIKELIEKNSQLEQENSLLKTLASPEQLAQFQAQLQSGSPPSSSSCSQPPGSTPAPTQPSSQSSGPSA